MPYENVNIKKCYIKKIERHVANNLSLYKWAIIYKHPNGDLELVRVNYTYELIKRELKSRTGSLSVFRGERSYFQKDKTGWLEYFNE